jgi:hypothetical protein
MNLFFLHIALHLSSIFLSYGQNTDCGEMQFHFCHLIRLGVDHPKSLNFRENLLGVLHWYDIYGH